MSNLLVAGPFIGDFQQEVTCFAPYIRYIAEINDYDKVFVSSHVSRRFLYHWIPEDRFIPVYENLSRDELKQSGYIHQDISLRDFNLITKNLKEIIIRREECSIRNLDIQHLSYIKSVNAYSYYQKAFYPFKFQKTELPPIQDYILFIPDNSLQEDFCIELYGELLDKYYTVVAGDQKCHLDERNVLLKLPDYFENGYVTLMNYIRNARFVICPSSHWTYLCNILKVPVFSWGVSPATYRHDGVFGFGNKKNTVMVADYDVDVKDIMRQVNYFIENKLKENM